MDGTDTFKSLFQIDSDNNNFLYQLMPVQVPFETPAVFASQQSGYMKKLKIMILDVQEITL